MGAFSYLFTVNHEGKGNMMKFGLYISLVLGYLAVVSTAATYNGYEQANYTIIQVTDVYEHRRYPASIWVATPQDGAVYDDIGSAAFRRLNAYIEGENSEASEIEMTVPVITAMPVRTCAFCNATYTMHFYIPRSIAESEVPTPTNSLLDVDSMPAMEVYVRQFTGRATGNDWYREASKLHDDLNAYGINDDQLKMDAFFSVKYDSPWKILNRRNEVWIVKAASVATS